MSDELLRLADAVECYKVEGPWDIARDRERDLNERIAIAAGVPCTVKVGHPALGDERTIPARIPAYTASLDAAMSLVPAKLRLMLTEWDDEKHLRAQGPWQAVLSEPGQDASFDAMRGYRCEHAATPALALTAAALRARAFHLRMEVE